MVVDKEKLKKAKEIIGDRNADLIAEFLSLEKYDRVNKKALCPWHREDTPSFIYNPKCFSFHCFGCQRNTDLIDALMFTGKTYIEAAEWIFNEAGMPQSFGERGVKTKAHHRYPKPEPERDRSRVLAYLATRCISEATANRVDIREDANGNIVFNYYDTNDVLGLVKYRPSHKITKGDNKTWCQKDSDPIPLLFNMNRINVAAPLYITEGEIDCMAAIEAGFTNTVSVPLGAGNFHWIEENFDFLEQFERIIVCSDNDEAGEKMRKECVYRLGSWRTQYIEIPKTIVTQDGVSHSVKDLNEVLYFLGKDGVVALMNDTHEVGVPSVVDIADVKDIDLDEMDGITTGLKPVDHKLMKLFYGTLTVVTGQPGAGKTSLLDQWVAQSIDNGINAWVFSREMPTWMTRSWLNYILAGPENVKAYTNNEGAQYYKVKPEAKNAIWSHYKGKLYLYKDDESNKFEDLLVSMKDTVRRYGTKLLILDNLMMIDIGAGESNLLEKQTEVITKLIGFAMKYNVAIVLVAHPRKMEQGASVGMYDISGTSNIINLAHRSIGLNKLNEEAREGDNAPNVNLTILKDRLRGTSGFKIGLFYDVPTRRFFTDQEEYGYRYNWDTTQGLTPKNANWNLDEIFGDVV